MRNERDKKQIHNLNVMLKEEKEKQKNKLDQIKEECLNNYKIAKQTHLKIIN